jgi:hypothetical protein
LLAALACLGALTSSSAAAETPIRGEYVEQLETICKPDANATQRAIKGLRGDVQAERLKRAAEKFSAAGSIFGGTVKEIAVIPRPAADRAKLGKWFTYLKRQERYLNQIATHFRADRPIAGQRLLARFIHNGNLANNTVLAFGFNFCSFKFSRFG